MDPDIDIKIPTDIKECEICLYFYCQERYCMYCLNKWCINCDKKIFACPYCRKVILNREEQYERNKIQLYYWVFNETEEEENYGTTNRTTNICSYPCIMFCITIITIPLIFLINK